MHPSESSGVLPRTDPPRRAGIAHHTTGRKAWWAAPSLRRPGPQGSRTSIDWRGWLALAWVLWFGLLYGKMVVEQRGQRLRAIIPAAKAR